MEQETPRITPTMRIAYYTDPLCSWSWALEPQWRRLRYEFDEQIAWRYSMGGLIADWQSFSDPLNAISRPAQMGPQWFQVQDASGMPIDGRIWADDPPTTSYPACIAVKAAERQGARQGERYLRRLREAVMLERRNIAHRETLLDLARPLATDKTGCDTLDIEQFEREMDGQEARDAFRDDMKDARYRDIGRFPTLILRHTAGPAVIIIGFRPYTALRAALERVGPGLEPCRSAENIVAYAAYWGRITARESAEALEMRTHDAEQALDDAVAAGALRKITPVAGMGVCYYGPAG